ncbi:MAG: TraR/DksA C4-type zinc finger protein [Candidatus Liptonbacteria bacterium]|nr:TraR/DksA C4-type zinc finger protein [Candidatus Liptonbacteria bacterium]
MLEKSDIEKYQSALEHSRRRLVTEIESEKPADFGSDVESSFDEEADEAEELNNKLVIQRALKDQLNEIDGALNRVKLGSYGACIKCGKEIEKEVLDLVPESELCEGCKKTANAEEKV